jgi:hypothetical protein
MNDIHYTVAVWNRPYVDMYLNLSLPSQLSKNNLPALKDYPGAIYKIFTTKEDESYMRKHPAFKKLTSLIDTKIIAIDDVEEESRYSDLDSKFSNLSVFHNDAILDADKANASIVFLFPDFVLADGTFPTLLKIRDNGYRAVMTLTLRLTRETAFPDLIKQFYSKSDHCFNDSTPREMVNVGLKHLHPIEKSYFWGKGFSSFPIHAYWPVRDEGLVGRGFYLHPLLIHPAIKGESSLITIDADYIDRACPDLNKIYVIKDSDELTCFELTSGETADANAAVNKPFKPTAKNYAHWAIWHANPFYASLLHHWLFQVPVKIHSKNFSWIWTKTLLFSLLTAKLVKFYSTLLRNITSPLQTLRFFRTTKIKPKGLLPFRIVLELTKTFRGLNWGEVSNNEYGEVWRWLGPRGRASISLELIHKCDYVLKTEIRTVINGSHNDLCVKVNGLLAENQHISRQDDLFYHLCVVPKKFLLLSKDNTEISYFTIGDNTDIQMGLSTVLCQPRMWQKLERIEKRIQGIFFNNWRLISRNYTQKITTQSPLVSIKKNETSKMTIQAKNTSRHVWGCDSSADYFVQLAIRWLDQNGIWFFGEGIRTPLPKNVKPGETIELGANIQAPDKSGDFVLRLTMVREGVAWFDEMGASTLEIPVNVAD